MGRIFIDGDDYTGNYLGAYPEAKNQIFDKRNSVNIVSTNVQDAISDLDSTIGDMSSISNLGTTVVEAIESLDSKIGQIDTICDGVQIAKVFDTFADMETWLKNSANKGMLAIGNNLYLKELNVPDYWVAEVLETADTVTGYYYVISPLETQKVDLSEYDAKIGNTDISGIGDGTLTGAISDINSERTQLFQYVSDGKTLVANAITDRGVNTAVDAEFATMASNIGKIDTELKLQEKTVTIDTVNDSAELFPDDGYHGLSKVTANIVPQDKDVTINYGFDTIVPDDGKILNSVTINGPTNHTNKTQTSGSITKTESGDIYVGIPADGYYDTTSKISVATDNLGNKVTVDNNRFTGTLNLSSFVDKEVAYLETVSMTETPYSFYYGSSVVYNDEIHILGGGGGVSKNHYKYNGSSWESVDTLPYNFYKGQAVVLNGEIHILGSYNTGLKTNHYKYNGSTWENASTLPYEFQEGQAVVLNNEIHILGGSVENTSTNHYKWNGSSWVNESTLPYEFYEGAAVVLNGEIHILGSYKSGYHTNHYRYNGSSWVSVSTLPYVFYHGSAVVHNNEIHILGGELELRNHYKYNGSTWESVSTLNHDFYYGSTFVYDNNIYALGGYSETACDIIKYSKTLAMVLAPYVGNQTISKFLIS